MGIPQLTTFINDRKNFSQWKKKVVERTWLVVDGKNLCHHLYKSLDWQYGGQYPQFHERVVGYFKQLKESNIKAIVVYDGIDYKEEKVETTMKRKQNIIIGMSQAKKYATQVLPSLAFYEFQRTLSDPEPDLGVEQVVVDGEADIVIAQLANYYKCPVLSKDSDFYMYALEGGFIPIDKFIWNKKVFVADVYDYRAFVKQFELQSENMRLIIPAIVGNDFLPEVCDPSLTTEYKILSIVRRARQFKDAEEFISTLKVEKNALQLQVNYRKCIEIYDENCKTSRSLEDAREGTELRKFDKSAIPLWIIDQFKSCSFMPSLMEAYVLKKSILCVAIDDHVYHRESSLLISRPIRQALYSILGIGRVTEHVRVKKDNWNVIKEQNVFASNGTDLPRLEDVPFLSLTEKRRVLYSILGCGDKHNIDSLVSDELRLVAASIVYWRAHANPPAHVVKALLLCFIHCSGAHVVKALLLCFIHCSGDNLLQEYQMPDEKDSCNRGAEMLSIIHYFAQWQSTYCDIISLNQVLQQPLQALSPGRLYDGKLAVYFVLTEHTVEANLSGSYQRLYELLFSVSTDAIEAKRSHGTTRKTRSSQQLDVVNRFAPLAIENSEEQ